MDIGDKGTTLDGLKASHDYLNDKIGDLKSDLGSTSDLDTMDKTSLVAAINEVASNSGGSGDGLSVTAKTAILTLFRSAAYTGDVSALITILEAEFNGSSDDPEEEVTVSQSGTSLIFTNVATVTSVSQSGTLLTLS